MSLGGKNKEERRADFLGEGTDRQILLKIEKVMRGQPATILAPRADKASDGNVVGDGSGTLEPTTQSQAKQS